MARIYFDEDVGDFMHRPSDEMGKAQQQRQHCSRIGPFGDCEARDLTNAAPLGARLRDNSVVGTLRQQPIRPVKAERDGSYQRFN